jgi:hypothetical protein
MYSSAKSILLAFAILLAGLPAEATEEAAVAPVAAPAAHASIHCPGITSVPMTADATQALPLRLVRTLLCDESVAILSDNEGYTVHVSTFDGKDGYVARVYLSIGGSPANVAEHQPASAIAVNNVVRWQAGASGCDQFFSKGHTVESATANGVTVQVSLEDSGWKLRATIAISNQSEEVIELSPVLITLDELQPNLKTLLAQDPAKLSHVVNHQVLLTQANAQPSPSAVTFLAVNPQTLGAAGYRPPTPDYFGDHLALASTNNRPASAPSAAELKSMALKHSKLTAGQRTAGVTWFERDGSARELSLRVPVGDLVFDFPLSFEQRH